jgi:ABC-type amino acid transport substrate-binding protein
MTPQILAKALRATLLTATALLLTLGAASHLSAAGRQVTFGTEGVYAPFTFQDDNGQLTGYDIEVVREIGKREGLDVKFVPTPWDSMFLALDSKKFDGVANQISKNPDREKKYAFSDSYLLAGAQIIVRSDRTGNFSEGLASLKGLKVGTGVGSNFAKYLEEFNAKNGNAIQLKYYDGTLTPVLQDIVSGRLDATLNERLTVGYNVSKLGLKVKVVGAPIEQSPSYFVFRKDADGEALAAQFSKGLAELKHDGTLAKLSQKWFAGDFTK